MERPQQPPPCCTLRPSAPPRIRVADDAVLVTVANVETYRGFLSLTPKAVPIDGLFDVAVVPRVSKVVLIAGLLRLMIGWGRLKLYRGRRVVVTTPRRREELAVRWRALRSWCRLTRSRSSGVERWTPLTAG